MNDRPNIVFVITDQQRWDTIAALGCDHVDTPVLDRVVGEGTAFTRAYVTAPSCSPSRSSLFTGVYPHTLGVLRNEETWRHSWVEQLAASGYHCVSVGKMHTHPWETPMGFHERTVVENKDRDHPGVPFFHDALDKALHARGRVRPTRRTHRGEPGYRDALGAFEWELEEDLHPDVFVGQQAVWWLDSYPRASDAGSDVPGSAAADLDAPFFLQVGFPGPHPPYDPVARHLDAYRDRDVPLPVRSPADLAAQPDALAELRAQHEAVDHDSVVHRLDATDEQERRRRRHYFANVTMIDEQVGLLLDALERRGVLQDTVLVVTSDHGDALGDHGHSQKWTMYDSSVRVPCLVWAPGRVAAGRQVDDLVSVMDLGPTVLELAGLQPPAWMEARSLVPALAPSADAGASTWAAREHVFSEHARDMILTGTELMTMVRDDRWKLVELVDSDQGQLFDLQADPTEEHDLWPAATSGRDPAAAAARERLLGVLARWRARSALHTADMHREHR